MPSHLAVFLHKQPQLLSMRGVVTEIGDRVRFNASDVFLSNPEGAFVPAPGEEEMEGTVIDFSDSSVKAQVFAVVDVIIRRTFIVPVEKLKMIKPPGKERFH